MDKTLSEQIAASDEDIKVLLEGIAAIKADCDALIGDNRTMSIAYLGHMIKDLERQTQRRIQALESDMKKRQRETDEAITKLEKRLNDAARMFRGIQKDVEALKGNS